jgi:hypothetical protein
MLRLPAEPDPKRFPDATGVVIPQALDFRGHPQNGGDKEDEKQKSEEWNRTVQRHVQECIDFGCSITDPDNNPQHAVYTAPLRTESVPVTVGEEAYTLDIQVETIRVAGVSDRDILGVRHSVTLPIAPEYFLNAYNRLNYTSAIDKFTYLVEMLEDVVVPTSATSSSTALPTSSTDWCHVAYTGDQIIPGFSIREFVTLDFMSRQHEHGMLCSRSCQHGQYEITAPPDWTASSLFTNRQRYRVPLLYYQRVLPVPDNPQACRVVQFQFSDIGGLVPPAKQTAAVVQFGIDNLPKAFALVKTAENKGIVLGTDAGVPLIDPLKSGWKQKPTDMIPGL